jgi:hypothetical protein
LDYGVNAPPTTKVGAPPTTKVDAPPTTKVQTFGASFGAMRTSHWDASMHAAAAIR